MKIGNKQAIGENLLYLLVWSAIILVPVLNSQMLSEMHVDLEAAWTVWRQIIPYLTIFLVHNYLIAARYLPRRKYGKYLFFTLLVIVIVFSAVELNEHYLDASGGMFHAFRTASFTNHDFYWNIVFALFMNGTNSAIKLFYQSLRDEQQMQFLTQENLRAEMETLKYQINPHFFMNTLNNIHALIDIDGEAAKSAVIDLSKMMRYVLYDSERETISLAADIQFLKNYIELMRIRYTDRVEITIDYPPALPDGVSIPPLLLIVFVENAFKHGVSYNRKSFIRITISCADEQLTAVIRNSRHTVADEEPLRSGGIGLENVRKRLELTYGSGGYTLDLHEESDSYTVKLVIPISHA